MGGSIFVINNVFLNSNMHIAENNIHTLIENNSLKMYAMFACAV